MLGYLSLDIICSSKPTVFLELRSRKTVRFPEQIMSADKYQSIFSSQIETIVYIDIIVRLRGSKTPKLCIYSSETSFDVHLFRLNFDISKLFYFVFIFHKRACRPCFQWFHFKVTRQIVVDVMQFFSIASSRVQRSMFHSRVFGLLILDFLKRCKVSPSLICPGRCLTRGKYIYVKMAWT